MIRSIKNKIAANGSPVQWAFLLGLTLLTFLADTLTDFEIAAAVFYVAVVLMAAEFLPARIVLAVAALCSLLTIVSLLITPNGNHNAGRINGFLSIAAIAATAYLALKRSNALVAETEARAQLLRLARVNALGEMTASIAHEVNQPLTGIIASGKAGLNWLALETPNLAKARQALKRMIDDAERASGIVGRVRNLSRRAEPKAEWHDVVGLIEEALLISKPELDKNDISAVSSTGDHLLVVFADGVQVQQVLLNLFLNAIESIARDGIGGNIEILARMHGDKHVEFIVSDDGAGIDPRMTDRLFDAFHSSKPDGMGLGLAISRSIVESHDGRIWAKPGSRAGASFHFILPGRRLEIPR